MPALAALALLGLVSCCFGQLRPPDPEPSLLEPVYVAADSIRSWTEPGRRVLLLKGHVYLAQGLYRIRCPRAVVWLDEAKATAQGLSELQVYAEGGVEVQTAHSSSNRPKLRTKLRTQAPVRFEMHERLTGSAVDDPLYQRAVAGRSATTAAGAASSAKQAAAGRLHSAGARAVAFVPPPATELPHAFDSRLTLNPRGFTPFHVETVTISPTEKAYVFTGGINVVLRDEPGGEPLDIVADRMVLWSRPPEQMGTRASPSNRPPLQFYLEGNVIFRKGQRTIETDQIYYDADRHVGVANNAQMQAYHEKIKGPITIRARKLRQVAENKFVGEATRITASRFPVPSYEMRTRRVIVEEQALPLTNMLTGQPVADPRTGQPVMQLERRATGIGNTLVVGGVPVLYWPYVESSLDELSTPLRGAKVRQSRSFGTEIHTNWDLFRLLGRERPDSIGRWDLQLDYLSRRGPAVGTDARYSGYDLGGLDGPYWGRFNAWWIQDNGTDRLGAGRINVPPEQELRGRALFRHRQVLPNDFTLNLEASWISDINFLEQFFEQEWEEDKDQETLVYLKQQRDNWAWSVLARARVLDFLTTTNYLPRVDHYLIGQPLFNNRFTYFTHSNVAYMELLRADRSHGDITVFPDMPAIVGGRFDTLHELDLPLRLGAVEVTPYALGRISTWSDTLTLGAENRLYGGGGARASMPLWRLYPCVESGLLNLHALAHKIVFDLDYLIAYSDLDHTLLPQYDELEEDVEQIFRQRFLFRDYAKKGKPFPLALDPQLYAIRTGLMTHAETLDDLQVLRLNIRQRLQTKRGRPGARRIIDWMKLDLGAAWFPNEDRDNFGEPFGLFTYEYAWFIGDRTSITSEGWFETFDQGPQAWNIGLFMARPPRGSVHLGYTSLAPVGSRVGRFIYNYYMSPKWVSSFATSYDFGESRNLGQVIGITRIGADLVVRVAVKFNPLRSDYGVGLEVVPRILPELGAGAGAIGRAQLPLDFAPVE